MEEFFPMNMCWLNVIVSISPSVDRKILFHAFDINRTSDGNGPSWANA
jgi:hypothetical protein